MFINKDQHGCNYENVGCVMTEWLCKSLDVMAECVCKISGCDGVPL